MTTLPLDLSDELYQEIENHANLSKTTVVEYVLKAIQERISSNHTPNALTLQTMADVDHNQGLSSYETANDFFKMLNALNENHSNL